MYCIYAYSDVFVEVSAIVTRACLFPYNAFAVVEFALDANVLSQYWTLQRKHFLRAYPRMR